MTDLSFVLVEYKDLLSIEEAVRSICDHLSVLSVEIIIVSNSSYRTEEQASITLRVPFARFVFNPENRGFGKAVNQGIEHSKGDFVILFNPDARIVDDSLLNAVDFMRNNSQVACIGPLVTEQTGGVQDSCRVFMTPPTLFKRMYKRLSGAEEGGILECNDHSSPHQVDWVSGACILARRNAIEEVGLLDERYFMYVEDMDWCRSFHEHGWQVWYFPSWNIEHNAGRASTTRIKLLNRLVWTHISSYIKYLFKWYISKPLLSSKKKYKHYE